MSSSNEGKATAARAESSKKAGNPESDLKGTSQKNPGFVADLPPDWPVPSSADISDFDDEFDDDFEAETPGEYELDDDDYARQLVEMVDFEIEGLEGYSEDLVDRPVEEDAAGEDADERDEADAGQQD